MQVVQAGKRRGLREQLAFVGCSGDGQTGFRVVLELRRPKGSRDIDLDVVIAAFDRRTGEVQCMHDQETVSWKALRQTSKAGDWRHFSANFASGSFLVLQGGVLRGRLHTRRGSAAFELTLTGDGASFQPYASERMQQLPVLPGLDLPSQRMTLAGQVACAGMVLKGEFQGACWHEWSSRHAEEQASAFCNRFARDESAFFSGISLRYNVVGEWLQVPYLSMASLFAGGEWYHFNSALRAASHAVTALDNYRWLATFENRWHRLEVTIDGANPRVEPWLGIYEASPGGQFVVAKNTLFAAGKLRLYERANDRQLLELGSEHFCLETRWPAKPPTPGVRVAKP